MWHLKPWISSKCVIQAWSLIQYPLKHNLICYIWMFKWLHVKLAHRWQFSSSRSMHLWENGERYHFFERQRQTFWLHPWFRFTPNDITWCILLLRSTAVVSSVCFSDEFPLSADLRHGLRHDSLLSDRQERRSHHNQCLNTYVTTARLCPATANQQCPNMHHVTCIMYPQCFCNSTCALTVKEHADIFWLD